MIINIGNKIGANGVGCRILPHLGRADKGSAYGLPGLSDNQYLARMAEVAETDENGKKMTPEKYEKSLPRFITLSQEEHIYSNMSEAGRFKMILNYIKKNNLLESKLDYSWLIKKIAQKWIEQTGTGNRVMYLGSVIELAAIAAYNTLIKNGVDPRQLDAIIVATNTGTGYPSLADHVKDCLAILFGLGEEEMNASCFDVQEACTAGGIAIQVGWEKIRTGEYKKVLVVAAEKGTILAHPDDINANLFTDEAAGAILEASETDEFFTIFSTNSRPSKGKSGRNGKKAIYKMKDNYFFQESAKVQYFVGNSVLQAVQETLTIAGVDWSQISDIISHQPSGRSLNEMEKNLRGLAKEKYKAIFHRRLDNSGLCSGNSSSASTLFLLSKLFEERKIKDNSYILVITFGAGTSWCIYIFKKT